MLIPKYDLLRTTTFLQGPVAVSMLYPNTPLTGLEIWVTGNRLQGWLPVSHPPAKGGRVGRGESAYRVGLSSDTSAPPSWGAGPQQESPGRYDSSTLVGGRRRRRPPPFRLPATLASLPASLEAASTLNEDQ